MRSSCRSDCMANCMSVSPGGKEALMCLEKNMAKLSPACQKSVGDIMPKAPPAAAAAPRPLRHHHRPPRLRHLRLRHPRPHRHLPNRGRQPRLRHCMPPHRRQQGQPRRGRSERAARALPLGLHRALLERAAGRPRCARLLAEECREPVAGLPARGAHDPVGATPRAAPRPWRYLPPPRRSFRWGGSRICVCASGSPSCAPAIRIRRRCARGSGRAIPG